MKAGDDTSTQGASELGTLVWSDERPAQEGWYWWRANPDIHEAAFWEVLYVGADGDIPERGSHVNEYCLLHAHAQWAGPLPLPQ